MEDLHEIQNIMGKYLYYTMASMIKERNDLFAKKAPGIRVYFGEMGYFEGPDAPQRAWGNENQERPGKMPVHAPVCPVVEVAGNGKTAKGVWLGIGLLAGVESATWEWDKYGVDFIKEDGKWRIWHHHIYRLFHGLGWDDKWTDQFTKKDVMMPPPGKEGDAAPPMHQIKTDGPAIDDNPLAEGVVQRLVPKPPEPYECWEETTSY
jgi:hypothetical protein